MSLTYEQFKSIVPKETATFVSNALPYLDAYLKEDVVLVFNESEQTTGNIYSKANFLLLYCLSDIKEYGMFLKKYGFNPDKYKINDDLVNQKGNLDEMFERWNRFFNIYSDETLYERLTPLDIVSKAFDDYVSNCNHSIFQYLFPLVDDSTSTFKMKLLKKQMEKKIELEHEIEKELYGNLPISVISYLETASKLRSLLFKSLSKNQDIVKPNEADIVPISLLLALYYGEQSSEQKMIQEILSTKGVDLEKIKTKILIEFSRSTVKDTKRNVFALKQLYARYYQSGANEGIVDKDITISKILNNLFDRNFTGSLALEKVFAKLNCDIGSFYPVDEMIKNRREIHEQELSTAYVESFYGELSKEVREFIEFTTKTYSIILEKMKAKTHNIDVLANEDDVDTLALFIASYFYNVDVSEFFKDYKITLEKVLKFLNLQLTRKEIEATKLNQRTLVDRYQRFVYEGVNGDKRSNTIKINDIVHNLCNRNFNRSMIMENIFSRLTNLVDLQSDFLNQMKDHFEKKEQNRKMYLTQRLFKDMPSATIKYLEDVSRIHQYLMSKTQSYSEMDIRVFSLLLGILNISNNEVAEFFKSKKLTIKSVCKYLNIDSSNLLRRDINIDILIKQYGIFIFGGHNRNLQRKDITIFNIARNIFEKSIHNSVLICKFLGSFDLSYEDFENLSEKMQEYLKESDGKSLIKNLDNSTTHYIVNVLRIHQRLINIAIQNETIAHIISNIADIRELSMILGIFTVDNNVKYFFEKYKITLENICAFVGLHPNIVSNLGSEEVDYRLIIDAYEPFIKYGNSNYKSIEDIIPSIFDKQVEAESFVLEEIVSFVGANYDILKEEVLTRKDYELSLTIDERIKILSEAEIDSLDVSDVKSILYFGNSLSIHSKYIQDELPRLIMSDVHDESVQAINQIVDQIYTKDPTASKKRSLFQRLFSAHTEKDESKVLNSSVIQKLKNAIDSNIDALSKELLGYDSIRKYIEVYRKKNQLHFMVAMSEAENLEKEVKELNPDNEEEYASFLTATSKLQIMRDKSNRFRTTNHLMKQELLKINQAIVNHFITINALEMARDDLLPLIGSELAITQGRSTENNGLNLSENIIGLFQSLLLRNVTSAVENMERLRNSSLPAEMFELLNKDIKVYLNGLNQIGEIERRVETLDIDQVTTTLDYTVPELEFINTNETTLDNPKQKIKE